MNNPLVIPWIIISLYRTCRHDLMYHFAVIMIGYNSVKWSERNVETSSTPAKYCSIGQLTSFSV